MARKHIRFASLLLSSVLLLTGCGSASTTSEPVAVAPTEEAIETTEEEATEPLHASPEEALAKMTLDQKLHQIMAGIHEQCVKYGKEDGYINYVKGANVAGFMKVAHAMMAQGIV